MKTTIEIPRALLLEAKSYAYERGLSFKQVVEAGLRQVLNTTRDRSKPFRLRKHQFKGRGLGVDARWAAIRRQIYQGRGE